MRCLGTILLCALAFQCMAELPATWRLRHPEPAGQQYTSACYGGGKYVVFAEEGTVMLSEDLNQWTRHPGPSGIRGLTYGQGLFVAVGTGGRILTSLDGANWTARNSGANRELTSVAYGNGIFIGVGDHVRLQSRDGIVWWDVGMAADYRFADLAFGNGLFVCVGQREETDGSLSYTIQYSWDGWNWSWIYSPVQTELHAVCFAGDAFYAVGDYSTVLRSVDAVTWSLHPAWITHKWGFFDITAGNGKLITVGEFSNVAQSTNGSTWRIVPRAMSSNRFPSADSYVLGHRRVAFGPEGFVAAGDNGIISCSPDGDTWHQRFPSPTNHLRGIAYGAGTFVAVGDGRNVLTSSDGKNWIGRYTGYDNLKAVVSGSGGFVAVGWWESALLTSSNGLFWQRLRPPGTSPIGTQPLMSSVTYGSSGYVAIGFLSGRDYVIRSRDGVNWSIPAPSSNRLVAAAFGEDLYVGVGGDGAIATSHDGSVWTRQNSSTTRDLESVVYSRGRFFAGGNFAGLLTSDDGLKWEHRALNLTASILSDGEELVAANGSSIWFSADGDSWRTGNAPAHQSMNGLNYAAGCYFAVGNYGAILQSESLIQLRNPRWSATRGFEANFNGPLGRPYRIQASKSGQSWVDIHIRNAANTQTYFRDPAATNRTQRLYRIQVD